MTLPFGKSDQQAFSIGRYPSGLSGDFSDPARDAIGCGLDGMALSEQIGLSRLARSRSV